MYINVKVIPNSKVERIEEIKPLYYKIKTLKAPVKGEANKDVIRIISEYFNIKRKDIKILNGLLSEEKLIKLEGVDEIIKKP